MYLKEMHFFTAYALKKLMCIYRKNMHAYCHNPINDYIAHWFFNVLIKKSLMIF